MAGSLPSTSHSSTTHCSQLNRVNESTRSMIINQALSNQSLRSKQIFCNQNIYPHGLLFLGSLAEVIFAQPQLWMWSSNQAAIDSFLLVSRALSSSLYKSVAHGRIFGDLRYFMASIFCCCFGLNCSFSRLCCLKLINQGASISFLCS